jgi:hypothetical protein
MHRKYSDEIVCMSVSVDEADRKDAALRFLQKQGATFANYWLDEPSTVWQDRFEINGPPAVFVFDQEGAIAQKFDSSDPDKPYTYEDVEILVRELLKRPGS